MNLLDTYSWLSHSSLTATVRQIHFENADDYLALNRIFGRGDPNEGGARLDRSDMSAPTLIWDTLIGARDGTVITVRGAPAVSLDAMKRERRYASMFQTFVKKTFNLNEMLGLTAMGSYDQDGIPETLREELADMNRKIRITAEKAAWTAFYSGDETGNVGEIGYGVAGELLYGPTGTYSMLLPAEVDSSVDWSNAATDILGTGIPHLKETYFKNNGRMPRVVYISEKVAAYIFKNTSIVSAHVNVANLAERFLGDRGEFELGGLLWRNLGPRGTVASGTLTKFAGMGTAQKEDHILVFPDDPTREQMFRIYDGPVAIPTGAQSWEWSSNGIVSYAWMEVNPTRIHVFEHWCWLPVAKWPELFLRIDTVPE